MELDEELDETDVTEREPLCPLPTLWPCVFPQFVLRVSLTLFPRLTVSPLPVTSVAPLLVLRAADCVAASLCVADALAIMDAPAVILLPWVYEPPSVMASAR